MQRKRRHRQRYLPRDVDLGAAADPDDRYAAGELGYMQAWTNLAFVRRRTASEIRAFGLSQYY
jgi:hypothetical protein